MHVFRYDFEIRLVPERCGNGQFAPSAHRKLRARSVGWLSTHPEAGNGVLERPSPSPVHCRTPCSSVTPFRQTNDQSPASCRGYRSNRSELSRDSLQRKARYVRTGLPVAVEGSERAASRRETKDAALDVLRVSARAVTSYQICPFLRLPSPPTVSSFRCPGHVVSCTIAPSFPRRIGAVGFRLSPSVQRNSHIWERRCRRAGAIDA